MALLLKMKEQLSEEDDFSDLLRLSEISSKRLWDNEEDEVWNII